MTRTHTTTPEKEKDKEDEKEKDKEDEEEKEDEGHWNVSLAPLSLGEKDGEEEEKGEEFDAEEDYSDSDSDIFSESGSYKKGGAFTVFVKDGYKERYIGIFPLEGLGSFAELSLVLNQEVSRVVHVVPLEYPRVTAPVRGYDVLYIDENDDYLSERTTEWDQFKEQLYTVYFYKKDKEYSILFQIDGHYKCLEKIDVSEIDSYDALANQLNSFCIEDLGLESHPNPSIEDPILGYSASYGDSNSVLLVPGVWSWEEFKEQLKYVWVIKHVEDESNDGSHGDDDDEGGNEGQLDLHNEDDEGDNEGQLNLDNEEDEEANEGEMYHHSEEDCIILSIL